jgi:hypothetical protein
MTNILSDQSGWRLQADRPTVFVIAPRHVGKLHLRNGPVRQPLGAVESVALAALLILSSAVAPNSISCLVSRDTHLGLREIDGELQCLCFGADTYLGSDGRPASLLRGGEPVIAVHKEKRLVLEREDSHRR